MKKSFIAFLVGSFIASAALAQVKMPAPSPLQQIKQDFGLSTIELAYSRPALKGRKVFGTIVPFDSLWRTGANAATKIKFNEEVSISGQKVEAGEYAIYTIPHKNGEWTFILNKGANNSGVGGYKASDDVIRKKFKSTTTTSRVESFTLQFTNLTAESCNLNLTWDNVSLNIPIKVDIKEKVRAQIEAALASDNKPYFAAAQFYYDYDNNKAKALELTNLAIKESETPAFWMVYFKAKVQSEMGDKKGATETAKKGIELAKKAQNNDYVSLNEKLIQSMK